jgi:hypothetical protein
MNLKTFDVTHFMGATLCHIYHCHVSLVIKSVLIGLLISNMSKKTCKKTCQKKFKNFSKSYQKVVKKLSKSCQKVVKKLSKKLSTSCHNCISIESGGVGCFLSLRLTALLSAEGKKHIIPIYLYKEDTDVVV